MEENCVFCKIVRQELPAYVVFENEKNLAFFDTRPIGVYHTLVIPKAHYRDIFDIPEEWMNAVNASVRQITALYQQKLGIDSLFLLHNSGPYSLQSVFHYHIHIVPRFPEDQKKFSLNARPELVRDFPAMLARLRD